MNKAKILRLAALVLLVQSPLFAQKTSLKEAFKDKFLMGVAINRSQINQTNTEEIDLITSQFNVLTAENDMKWMHIHPKRDEFNFEQADKLMELARANDMFVVGHTLVWHSQLAPWVFKTDSGDTIGATELTHRLEHHISTIVSRYKGKVKGWDVVNEALAEDGSYRKSLFFQISGEAFIENAFRFAHAADPEAELYYNDYNLINAEKRDGAIRIINNLKNKGIKIDGIGVQAHWSLDKPSIEEIETAINKYSETGVKIMFTELDISVLPSPWNSPTADVSVRFENTPAMDPYPNGLPDSVQSKLAKRYADIFELFHKHSDKIGRVTFWGLHDGLSWKNNFPIRGRTDYTLLFDREMKPKKAYESVIQTVKD
ncbi:endo-1,4-beta-xylanase [Flagellimonas amoyensis]|uniref:endo-1,4-beta-xylanase n=1 Tax=Flagellimonas amoyensis TaxID=2169401 RepID=UPI000D3D103E|nr:endo-1,4-beta-xylanase [Allomuricauda amoyensis]